MWCNPLDLSILNVDTLFPRGSMASVVKNQDFKFSAFVIARKTRWWSKKTHNYREPSTHKTGYNSDNPTKRS